MTSHSRFVDDAGSMLKGIKTKARKGKKVVKNIRSSSPRSVDALTFARAAARVDFALIERRHNILSDDGTDQVARVMARAVRRALADDKLGELLNAETADIGMLTIDGADVGKIKAAAKDVLGRAFQTGVESASRELEKSRAFEFHTPGGQDHDQKNHAGEAGHDAPNPIYDSKIAGITKSAMQGQLSRVDFERVPTTKVPVGSLVSHQPMMNTSKLEQLTKNFDPGALTEIYVLRINSRNVVVEGNHRVLAARAKGMREIPSKVLDYRAGDFSSKALTFRATNLRNNAADFFEANAFRMAANLTDGMRAIIQQELLNAVKTGLRPEDVVPRIYDRLIRKGFTTLTAVEREESRSSVLAKLNEMLEDALQTANIPAYLNTLVRTNTFEALNEARFAFFEDPDLADFVVAYEYSAILDDSTTEICRELDDGVWNRDSEIWDTYRPPNHYNCRSLLVPIFATDGWDGVDTAMPAVEPQEGFK